MPNVLFPQAAEPGVGPAASGQARCPRKSGEAARSAQVEELPRRPLPLVEGLHQPQHLRGHHQATEQVHTPARLCLCRSLGPVAGFPHERHRPVALHGPELRGCQRRLHRQCREHRRCRLHRPEAQKTGEPGNCHDPLLQEDLQQGVFPVDKVSVFISITYVGLI